MLRCCRSSQCTRAYNDRCCYVSTVCAANRAVALTAVHPSCLQLSVQVPSCCGMPHVHATYLTHIEGSTEEQLLHSWPEHFLHLHDAEDMATYYTVHVDCCEMSISIGLLHSLHICYVHV